MKNLIVILSLILVFVACNEDPLGIEENVYRTEINGKDTSNDNGEDSTIKEVKTRFRADSIYITFSEKVIWHDEDSISQRWTALNYESKAILDTLNNFKLHEFFYTAQRDFNDSINQFRKEYIVGFSLELDSFKLREKYSSFEINKNYKSKLHLLHIQERKTVTIFGNYPIEIVFEEPFIEDDFIWISGRTTVDVPINKQFNKYDYFFVSTFHLRFPL